MAGALRPAWPDDVHRHRRPRARRQHVGDDGRPPLPRLQAPGPRRLQEPVGALPQRRRHPVPRPPARRPGPQDRLRGAPAPRGPARHR